MRNTFVSEVNRFNDSSLTFLSLSVTSTATPISGRQTSGAGAALAWATSVLSSTGICSGAARSALRVRVRAPFCKVGLAWVKEPRITSNKVPIVTKSTRQSVLDVMAGEVLRTVV